jgi:hypothetical protein
MLLLASTADKLRVVTTTTAGLHVHASWVDNNAGTITPGRTNTIISSATTTDVVASPAASTVRNIKTLDIRNDDASNANTVTVVHTDGTNALNIFKASLAAGEKLTYTEGFGWDIYASDGSHKAQSARTLFKVTTADETGQNVTTAQPWFVTSGGVTIDANTTYFFEGLLLLTTGATSHTIATGFGGTATVQDIMYEAWAAAGAAGATVTASNEDVVSAVTSTVISAAITAAEHRVGLMGTVRFTTAGTFIPQYTFSVNPTGTILTKKNTFFRMWPLGSNTVPSQGTWA